MNPEKNEEIQNDFDLMNAENDPILPEDWDGESDVFGLSSDEDETEKADAGVAAVPTTEPAPQAAEQAVPEEAPQEEAPTTEQPEAPAEPETVPAPTKFSFKARVDHEDQDVELDEETIRDNWQKSKVFDRYQQRVNAWTPTMDKLQLIAKDTGYDSVDEMVSAQIASQVDDLVEKGTPRQIAQDFVDRRYGLQNSAEPKTTEAPSETTPPARDFAQEIMNLWSIRPQLPHNEPLPPEVEQEALSGTDVVTAYLNYEKRTQAKQEQAKARDDEMAELRRQNEILRQNAEAAKRAPVVGTSGTSTNQKAEDPFEKGFDSDSWY